ncbi:MAG: aldo/keto reductase, partial [Pirellulales bacterium]
MRYTTLPTTEIRVSVVAMGCWALAGDSTWGPQDEAESIEAVHAALDAGINFFDTAEMYGAGLSEQRLGRALVGRRDEAVIASKFNGEHMAPKDVVAACERSLRNLQTDRIDLYQIHWASHTVPLADTWAELLRRRDEGKVRAIGVCNFGAGDLAELLAIGRPVTDQLPYSLLTRAIEYEVLPRCRQRGVGVLCYSPLLLGLLSGKYADADSVPDGRARTRPIS